MGTVLLPEAHRPAQMVLGTPTEHKHKGGCRFPAGLGSFLEEAPWRGAVGLRRKSPGEDRDSLKFLACLGNSRSGDQGTGVGRTPFCHGEVQASVCSGEQGVRVRGPALAASQGCRGWCRSRASKEGSTLGLD